MTGVIGHKPRQHLHISPSHAVLTQLNDASFCVLSHTQGDGVWEGLRLQEGVVLFAAEHLKKLFEGALAIDMHIKLSAAQILGLVYQAVDANGMSNASGE